MQSLLTDFGSGTHTIGSVPPQTTAKSTEMIKLNFFAQVGVAGEVAFSVGEKAVVDSTYHVWVAKGLTILQPLTEMDFGYTFVALDPDGHRLRVFASSEA